MLASVIPIYVFYALKRTIDIANAAAIAAAYGSVSAVTFVTATNYLDAASIAWSGHMVAAMALMESPAIIIGVLLYRYHLAEDGPDTKRQYIVPILKEACFNGSVFLVLGSLVIGWLSGAEGLAQVSGFIIDPFTGILCLFLLDMGIVSSRRFNDLREAMHTANIRPMMLVISAIAMPLINAVLALLTAALLGLSEGDAVLVTVLAASASYIAVPAAMRLTLPEANPSIFLPMSLTITFPLNIIVGIPLYHWLVGTILTT